MKAVHGLKTKQTQKVFKCNKCEFRTLVESEYAAHSESVHLNCEQCRFTTCVEDILNHHTKTKHNTSRRKRKSNSDVFDD